MDNDPKMGRPNRGKLAYEFEEWKCSDDGKIIIPNLERRIPGEIVSKSGRNG